MDEKVYRRGIAAGVSAGLGAALLIAIADVALAGGASATAQLVGLWLPFGLLFGLAFGVFLGAGNATFGPGFVRNNLRKLADHPEKDSTVAAAILAALVVLLVAIFVIGKLAVGFVGDVERKEIGGLLLGVTVVILLPILAAAALPFFRITRRVAPVIPRPGGIPATVVLLVLGLAGALAIAGLYIFTKLDWRALRLGSLISLAALPVLTILLAAFTSRLANQRPAPLGIAALVGAVVAIALPFVALRGAPSEEVSRAVIDQSWIGGRGIALLRGFSDADGDGESAFFGGPDCDDQNPDVRSGADEIAGNGIDDNCLGGDGKLDETATPSPAGIPAGDGQAPAAAKPLRAGAFDGNVLLVFVDTLRYDKLGFAGYRRDGKSLSPRLDALAAQSVVFANAFAQAPNTPRSVPSFLGSRYPSKIKFEKDFVDYPTVADDNEMLFETLSAAGLATSAFTSHFYFCDQKKDPTRCTDFKKPKHSNIRQGFAEWDNEGVVDVGPSNKDISAPRIVPRAIAKLAEYAKAKQRFAMMVHLAEPHSSYMEHEGWPITERGTAGLEQKYDYEIAFMDGWIGKLLDALDEHALADNTMVVVIADHGEAFGVHSIAGKQMFFHGQTLYNELIHVPLMFRIPKVEHRVVPEVVQLIDMAPTIVDAIGGTAPASWQGRSLAAAFTGAALAPAPAFAELMPAPAWDHDGRAMITGDGAYKVYFRKSDRLWEIYDLKKDPKETKNLAESHPEAAALKAQLTSWIERGGK
jgi:arylsulfatase A-like enzyme